MTDETAEQKRGVALTPGDIVAIETEAGTRYVQVTHARAPYPDVVRAIVPAGESRDPDEIAGGKTAFAAMVELSRSLAQNPGTTSVIGRGKIPEDCRDHPTFRVPIRNKAGEIVYWWTWDGDGLAVAPSATDNPMPLREIVPIKTLRARLAEIPG